MKCLKIIIISVFLIINANLFSQEIRPLTPEQQKLVDTYIEKAEQFELQGNNQQAVFYLNRIAFIYWDNQLFYDVIDYFLKAVPLNEKIGAKKDNQIIYSNLGLIAADMENFDKSLEYFSRSLEIRREIGIEEDIVSGIIDVAYVLQVLNDFETSNEYVEEATQIATDINNLPLLLICYKLAYENYDRLGNLKIAQEFQQKHNSLNEFLIAEQLKEEYQEKELETQVDLQKERSERMAKELELDLKTLLSKKTEDSLNYQIQTKADSIQQAEMLNRQRKAQIELLNKEKAIRELTIQQQKAKENNQKIIIYAVSGVLGLIFIILIIIYFNNKKIQRVNKELGIKNVEIESQKNIIEKANKNIKQSINYAKGIQKSMLPKPETLNEFLSDSFIMFKPRDVVSGDFYWYSVVNGKTNGQNQEHYKSQLEKYRNKAFDIENDKFLISAVDCTGHGVPGAFMSMVGYNLLDDIVGNGYYRPNEILQELHLGVRHSLKQEENKSNDGMDMSMCLVDQKARRIEFAGAKNPLFYISNGELKEIKGDKNPIGGSQSDPYQQFNNNIIEINEPTSFYLFSDGYVDQFGEETGRKFMKRKFIKLLKEIHKEPMEKQKLILEEEFKQWKGNRKQIDDVIVIGFRVN